MSSRTIFVAAIYHEAVYWIKQWGFALHEARIVQVPGHVWGLRFEEGDAVFVCGSMALHPDLIEALEMRGLATFIDAHDLDYDQDWRDKLFGSPRPRIPSALDLI